METESMTPKQIPLMKRVRKIVQDVPDIDVDEIVRLLAIEGIEESRAKIASYRSVIKKEGETKLEFLDLHAVMKIAERFGGLAAAEQKIMGYVEAKSIVERYAGGAEAILDNLKILRDIKGRKALPKEVVVSEFETTCGHDQ